MSELGRDLLKIWITFVAIGLGFVALYEIWVRVFPHFIEPFSEILIGSVLTWSLYALIYIAVRRKSIRLKAYNRELTRGNREKNKEFKKEHLKEYREWLKSAKKEYVDGVRNTIKFSEETDKEDERKRKEYFEDLSKTTTNLSDVMDIINTGEPVAVKALFRYIRGAYTGDEQEYLDRASHAGAYMEEMIQTGRLRPSQVKAFMKRRPKDYKKFAKYYRKKFNKEPPTYEEIYGVKQE